MDDVLRLHTGIEGADAEWLHLLTADWQLVADLSFADLVLWVPDRTGTQWVAAAQMRPTTGPTAFYDDIVGRVLPRGRRQQLDDAFDEQRICRERDPEWREDVPVREETIPVVRAGRAIAVVARHTNLLTARTPSRLELTYLQCADDLARMIAAGNFPLPGTTMGRRGAPRVGDGLIRIDTEGIVTYASPNGVSAYRRLGLPGDLVGTSLGQQTAALALHGEPVDEALATIAKGRASRRVDVEGKNAVLALRVLPLVQAEGRQGALVLVRDVTEIRRRERELLTKDATIREIHHRVKNNLQTVAALLRMQARRLHNEDARAALQQAVRRVGSIAVVHETLSRTLEETVDLDVVIASVLGTAVELAAAGVPVRTTRTGDAGEIPGEMASPLALAISELVHNAAEHGLRPAGGGTVEVSAERDDAEGWLKLHVSDDGVGLPPGFDLSSTRSLGLQIVRTLVEVELGGSLQIAERGAPPVPLRGTVPGRTLEGPRGYAGESQGVVATITIDVPSGAYSTAPRGQVPDPEVATPARGAQR
ncbi:MAG: sensor histidine kinase [Actinomycetes bacterium]